MYYFRPNFWEATSHIKRVQPTSARGSTLILNLSDLIPILRVLCFLLLFRSETTSPLKESTSSHRDSTSTLGLGGLIPQRLWPPSPQRCPRGAHNMGAHFKSPLRWLFDTGYYPHTCIWNLVYTALELRLTNTLWIIFSPKHNYVKLFFL